MVEIYGHKFTSAFGDEPNESWTRAVGSIRPEQIAFGLNRLQHRDDPWPPNAVEFRRMCLNQRTSAEAQQERCALGSAPALPPPHLNPEQAKPYLDEIKAMLQ